MTRLFSRTFLFSCAALPVLMLSACGGSGSGGDTVTEPYRGVPYTHERTAGTGVAYVRGKLLPPKETKTEMIAPAPKVEAPPPPPVEAPVTQGDKLFEKKQAK